MMQVRAFSRRPRTSCAAAAVASFCLPPTRVPVRSSAIMGDSMTRLALPPRLGAALRLSERARSGVGTLHIFDFDGTLVRTPGPEEGRVRYQKATGKAWKGGWWGRVGSLSPPVLESPVDGSRIIRTVWDEFSDVANNSATSCAVVVTGRCKPLRPDVLRILAEAAGGKLFLDEDAVFTHPGGRMTTLEWKQALIYSLVVSDPLDKQPLKNLHIWEDRREHADAFAQEFASFIKDKTDIQVTVHFVPPEMP